MTIDEQLNQLADKLEGTKFQEGETTIGPAKGQSLESFQGTVAQLRLYAAEGLIEIRSEHQEKRSGERHIDRVRVRMGPDGVRWRKQIRQK